VRAPPNAAPPQVRIARSVTATAASVAAALATSTISWVAGPGASSESSTAPRCARARSVSIRMRAICARSVGSSASELFRCSSRACVT
jgi:hypothetical protein